MGERQAGGDAATLARLFEGGTVVGLSDAELLRRYAVRDDRAVTVHAPPGRIDGLLVRF